MAEDESTTIEEPNSDVEVEPDEAPKSGSSRGWRITAAISAVLAAVALGVLGSLLFGGSDSETTGTVLACVESRDFTDDTEVKERACPPKGATFTDGLVEKAEGGDFTIREIQQGKLGASLKLQVRRDDRPYIDVQHAQTHAALGQPVRVYTKRHEGRQIVVYMEDSPLLQ